MKKNFHIAVSPLTLAVAGAFCHPAFAADDVAELSKPASEISVGIVGTDSNAPGFGQYNGLDRKTAALTVDANIVKRDDATGTWMGLRANGITTRDNVDIAFRGERQGLWRYSVDWSSFTAVNPFRVNTANAGVGSDIVTVPVAAIAVGTGSDVTLKTRRETLGLGYSRMLGDGLEFSIKGRNQHKSGARLWGAQGLNFAPEPIDFTIRELETTIDYTATGVQLSGGYLGSWFNNDNKKLTLINGGSDEVALPPDNSAHQVFLAGGVALAKNTRGTFKVSYTRGQQNDGFMDVTNASGTATTRSNLGGRVDTTLAQFGISSRPIRDLTLRAAYRYEDRNDKTPVDTYINSGGHQINIPLSRTFKNTKLDADYRLAMGITANAGIEYDERDRSTPPSIAGIQARQVSFQPHTEEATLKFGLRGNLVENLNGSIFLLDSNRKGGGYLDADDNAAADVIDPIHWADRDRTKVRLALDWMPVQNLSLQFQAENSRDKYDGRELGPRSGDANFLSVDASYAINDEWNIHGWVSREDNMVDQSTCSGAAGCASLTWNARLQSLTKSAGFGIEGKPREQIKVGGKFQYSRDDSRFDLTRVSGTTAALTGTLPPDYFYKSTRFSLFTEYEHAKNSTVRLDYIYSRTRTSDWTWNGADGANQFVYTDDGSTVIHNPDERVNFIGISYRHRWQ